MLIHFLTVSGTLFWLFVGAILIIDVGLLATDDENEGWAVFITICGLLAATLFTDAFDGVRIAYLVAGLLAYILVGVLWSFKKWYSFVVDKLDALKKSYSSADKQAKGNETFEGFAKNYQPKAAENKQRIIGWMALWPFSLSWWVLTWPRHAFVWAYNRLSTVFDRISAKIWASAR